MNPIDPDPPRLHHEHHTNAQSSVGLASCRGVLHPLHRISWMYNLISIRRIDSGCCVCVCVCNYCPPLNNGFCPAAIGIYIHARLLSPLVVALRRSSDSAVVRRMSNFQFIDFMHILVGWCGVSTITMRWVTSQLTLPHAHFVCTNGDGPATTPYGHVIRRVLVVFMR